MAELANSDYPGLPGPYTDPIDGDLHAVYNTRIGLLQKVDQKFFNPSGTSANYQWLSNFDYPVGAIRERGGKWWRSLQTPNLAQVPATGSLFWVEENKSPSGYVFYEPGVFTTTSVFVLSAHNGEMQQFVLASGVRPYLSSDIAAEEDAGDWVSFTETLLTAEVDTTVANLDLNFRRHRDFVFFGSDPVIAPSTIALIQDVKALSFTLSLNIGDVAGTVEFPDFISEEPNWDAGTKVWTPLFTGDYKFRATKQNGVWFLERVQGLYV